MLMAMLMEKHSEGEIVGRDAQSAFNTLRRDHMAAILRGQGWLGEWIDELAGIMVFRCRCRWEGHRLHRNDGRDATRESTVASSPMSINRRDFSVR